MERKNTRGEIVKDHVKGGALTEVSFFILLATYEMRHGYEIKQFIKEETKGRLILGAGTLYGAIHSLKKKGWIELILEDDGKKQYQIAEEGKFIAEKEKNRLKELLKSAKQIMEK